MKAARSTSHLQSNFDAFNRNGKIPQYELVIYYARIRHLVLDSILLLVEASTVVQRYAMASIARYVTKMNSHRKVAKRSVMGDTSLESVQGALLSTSMDLLAASMHQDASEKRSAILRFVLSRAEFVNLLSEIIPDIRSYLKLYQRAVSLRARCQPSESLEAQANEISARLGVDPACAYGLFRALDLRYRALEAIEHRLFGCYGRILAKHAKQRTPRKEAEMDTLQDGAPGLLHAIRTYDHISRKSFSSHISMWIKQRIYFWMKQSLNSIRLDPSTWQLKLTYDKERSIHEKRFGPLATAAIPVNSSLKPKQVAKVHAHQAVLQTISIDAPNGTGEEDYLERVATKQSYLTADEDEQRDSEVQAERQRFVHDILSRCPEDARLLLSIQFGLVDSLPTRALSPAAVLRERVRQIAARSAREQPTP